VLRLVYLTFLLGFAVAALDLFTSPFYRITSVSVRGAIVGDPSQVEESSGAVRSNIFLLNTRQVEQRVNAIGIGTVSGIQLELPNSVALTVDEPPPAYVWQTGDSSYLVSRQGSVLGAATRAGLPQIVDTDAKPVARGDTVDVSALRVADYVVANLPVVASFRPTALSYSQDRGVSVRSPDGLTIVVGDDAHLPDKLAAIPAARKVAATKSGASIVDVSIPSHPYVR
jgi:cell division septal protein FtsQ